MSTSPTGVSEKQTWKSYPLKRTFSLRFKLTDREHDAFLNRFGPASLQRSEILRAFLFNALNDSESTSPKDETEQSDKQWESKAIKSFSEFLEVYRVKVGCSLNDFAEQLNTNVKYEKPVSNESLSEGIKRIYQTYKRLSVYTNKSSEVVSLSYAPVASQFSQKVYRNRQVGCRLSNPEAKALQKNPLGVSAHLYAQKLVLKELNLSDLKTLTWKEATREFTTQKNAITHNLKQVEDALDRAEIRTSAALGPLFFLKELHENFNPMKG